MGADMLLEVIRVPVVSKDTALARVPDFVASMTDDELASVCNYLTGGDGSAATVAGLLVRAVNVVYEERRRDVAWWRDGVTGVEYFITGGMSWGDSPSEAFDAFSVLTFTDFDVVLCDPDWKPTQEVR